MSKDCHEVGINTDEDLTEEGVGVEMKNVVDKDLEDERKMLLTKITESNIISRMVLVFPIILIISGKM